VQIGRRTIIKEGSIINAFKSVFIGDSVIVDRDVFVEGCRVIKALYRSEMTV
jgi:carbonic anhydrase/acetyltransferase-like protein (isoleucine patch superfamily)